MNIHLLSIGTALPTHGIEQTLSATLAATRGGNDQGSSRLLPALYRRSGVKFRSSVLLDDDRGLEESQDFFPPALDGEDNGPNTAQRMQRYQEEAAPLAIKAAHEAIASSKIDRAAIAHLITVSCTGFAAPGVDITLIKQLGLSPTISRTHIGFMGCHGAFNALRTASALVHQSNAPALICAVELCSLHFAYGASPQQIVANSLFADGAGAAILAPAAPTDDAWNIQAHGSCLMPDSEDAMSWTVGNHGFAMTLSPQVPHLITANLKPWLSQWLAQQDLSIEAIKSWAVHPGGPRILDAVAEPLNLPREALADSLEVLSTCGNMSSPTILFILDRLRKRQAPRPCVALGFGPGLAIEAMLIR